MSRACAGGWTRPTSTRVIGRVYQRRADRRLTEIIRQVHRDSRGTYGALRVHADLRLGRGIRVGRKRVERLMRAAGLAGITRRRTRGCTRRAPEPTAAPEDLVNRQFSVLGPDRLWCADISEHPTGQGKVYVVVLDAYSRRVLGCSIADHLRTELVVDALQLALWRRGGRAAGCVHHSDHGCQYTSWAFGQRLREAGLLGSLGTVGDALDNGLVESFFATLQTELLDRRRWATRPELATAIFEYVECFYNPHQRHSALGYLSPNDYEHPRALHAYERVGFVVEGRRRDAFVFDGERVDAVIMAMLRAGVGCHHNVRLTCSNLLQDRSAGHASARPERFRPWRKGDQRPVELSTVAGQAIHRREGMDDWTRSPVPRRVYLSRRSRRPGPPTAPRR